PLSSRRAGMFGVDSTELAIVAILALIFIGPKDLPKVLRTVGYWVGRMRGMARHFTAGMENAMREAELEEMEKKWRAENERIMALHPADGDYPEPGAAPAPDKGVHPRPGFAADDEDPTPPEKRELP